MINKRYCMIFLGLMLLPSLIQAGEATVITLHQSACQFVEAEGGKQGYKADSFQACEKFNARTQKERLSKQHVLTLKPGSYVFRVYNDDVPYVLGFWLRGEGLGRLTLPSVSGGGIHAGESRDYTITLEKGEYLYSCPLNPTPDYRLVVSDNKGTP